MTIFAPRRPPITDAECARRDAILRAEAAAGERLLARAIPALIGATAAIILAPAAAALLQLLGVA